MTYRILGPVCSECREEGVVPARPAGVAGVCVQHELRGRLTGRTLPEIPDESAGVDWDDALGRVLHDTRDGR